MVCSFSLIISVFMSLVDDCSYANVFTWQPAAPPTAVIKYVSSLVRLPQTMCVVRTIYLFAPKCKQTKNK